MTDIDFTYQFSNDRSDLCKYLSINSIGKTSHKVSYNSHQPLDDYMITFITKGFFKFNNIANPDEWFLCSKGDFLIYYPGQKFSSIRVDNEEMERIWIHFSGRLIKPLLEDMGVYGKQYFNASSNFNNITESFNSLKNDLLLNCPTTASTIQHVIDFFKILFQNRESQTIKKALDKSMLYINQNYPLDIKIPYLASMCNLSVSHYIKLFKAFYKTTPHQVILDRRLSAAFQQLEASDTSISSIAENCGFSDRITFTQAFKRKYKKSPSSIRKTSKIE